MTGAPHHESAHPKLPHGIVKMLLPSAAQSSAVPESGQSYLAPTMSGFGISKQLMNVANGGGKPPESEIPGK